MTDGLSQISRRVQAPVPQPQPQPRLLQQPLEQQQQQPVYVPKAAGLANYNAPNEQLAHQQFLEHNAWARPQAPIHSGSHGTPGPGGLTHANDWMDAPQPNTSAKQLIRNLSGRDLGGQLGVQRTGSPFATPIPQRRAQQEYSSGGTVTVGNSDPADLPSSVLAAPPTTDRLQQHHQPLSQHSSPLLVMKQRVNGQTPSGQRELTGFRNISNISGISGASTIDAPLPGSAEKQEHRLPGLRTEASAPQQRFDTSQIHRHPDERKELHANPGFRPSEGAFGTPAPLQSGSGAL